MNIVITTRAKKDLEQLNKDSRKRVYIALENLIAGQRVDIKKLKGSENYRIRVGDNCVGVVPSHNRNNSENSRRKFEPFQLAI